MIKDTFDLKAKIQTIAEYIKKVLTIFMKQENEMVGELSTG